MQEFKTIKLCMPIVNAPKVKFRTTPLSDTHAEPTDTGSELATEEGASLFSLLPDRTVIAL